MRKSIGMTFLSMVAVVALSACTSGATTSTTVAQAGADTTTVSGTVSTDGSTSMEKVIGSLGEIFMSENPNIKFTYNPTGSGSGITAALEGRCDIGLASRYLKDAEKESGLTETILALDAIAVIVNTENPIKDLSMEDLQKIFKGEVTNWSEVGGADEEIVLIGREAGSGTRDGFEGATDTKDAITYRQELTSTGDVISTVSSNPAAIGYASLASVKDTIQVLSIDGVEPSEESTLAGDYALQRPFILVTKTDATFTPAVQAFIDYALSDAGKSVIQQAGAIPAN